MASTTSLGITRCCVVPDTSTIGDSPLTVTVSVTEPTFISTLIVAVNEPASSTPSRLTVLNPESENVTSYTPGRRSMMRYWPLPSVTTERVFSISAGLDTSTLTPGSTAPEESLTTPVTEPDRPWADAVDNRPTTATANNAAVRNARMQ